MLKQDAKAYVDANTERDSTGCLRWTGPTSEKGYGRAFFAGGVEIYAHRLVYELANGPIDGGTLVYRTCENPRCVEISHLTTTIPKPKTAEAKRRHAKMVAGLKHPGEQHPNAKITEDIVRYIRRTMAGAPRGTQRKLAEELGITETSVSLIVKRKSWAHVL